VNVSDLRQVVHELHENERLELTFIDNKKVTLTLERKSGRRARLRLAAAEDVVIQRLPATAAKRST
jgi:crotonobetainyl-CoA:carnitine CoA-transferase CaiB-like acyl-CoA transferase